jgi:hypothetical protein
MFEKKIHLLEEQNMSLKNSKKMATCYINFKISLESDLLEKKYIF